MQFVFSDALSWRGSGEAGNQLNLLYEDWVKEKDRLIRLNPPMAVIKIATIDFVRTKLAPYVAKFLMVAEFDWDEFYENKCNEDFI
jgi:hypothetical protein